MVKGGFRWSRPDGFVEDLIRAVCGLIGLRARKFLFEVQLSGKAHMLMGNKAGPCEAH